MTDDKVHNDLMANPGDLHEQVLVVEDDPEMGRLLERGLADEGYRVDLTVNGMDALIRASSGEHSVAVLDVMLPGMSGFELCRRLRDTQPLLPILMLTARDEVADRVRGLDAGADDYLVKPFALSELAARLRAIRRRESLLPVTRIEVGNMVIDNHEHLVRINGKAVALSPKEFSLLRLLADHLDETVPRETILTEVWGTVGHTDANVVDQYVSYLRRKLFPAASGVALTTARGVGFSLTTEP
jgi:two-component system OmpR family response regulator